MNITAIAPPLPKTFATGLAGILNAGHGTLTKPRFEPDGFIPTDKSIPF